MRVTHVYHYPTPIHMCTMPYQCTAIGSPPVMDLNTTSPRTTTTTAIATTASARRTAPHLRDCRPAKALLAAAWRLRLPQVTDWTDWSTLSHSISPRPCLLVYSMDVWFLTNRSLTSYPNVTHNSRRGRARRASANHWHVSQQRYLEQRRR